MMSNRENCGSNVARALLVFKTGTALPTAQLATIPNTTGYKGTSINNRYTDLNKVNSIFLMLIEIERLERDFSPTLTDTEGIHHQKHLKSIRRRRNRKNRENLTRTS